MFCRSVIFSHKLPVSVFPNSRPREKNNDATEFRVSKYVDLDRFYNDRGRKENRHRGVVFANIVKRGFRMQY